MNFETIHMYVIADISSTIMYTADIKYSIN